MSGDPHQCRINAAHCIALSGRAWRPQVRQAFSDLAEMWNRLAAETEADGTISCALSEMELGEAYEALPLGQKLIVKPPRPSQAPLLRQHRTRNWEPASIVAKVL